MVLEPDWKSPVIPGQFIYYYTMTRSIEDINKSKEDEFLLITPWIIHTKIYQLNCDQTERNSITSNLRCHRSWYKETDASKGLN